jgi:hypothetical protein
MIDRDVWLNAIAQFDDYRIADDQNAITCHELGVLIGRSPDTARRILKRMEAAGRAVATTKLIRKAGGKIPYPSPAYRLVDVDPRTIEDSLDGIAKPDADPQPLEHARTPSPKSKARTRR